MRVFTLLFKKNKNNCLSVSKDKIHKVSLTSGHNTSLAFTSQVTTDLTVTRRHSRDALLLISEMKKARQTRAVYLGFPPHKEIISATDAPRIRCSTKREPL